MNISISPLIFNLSRFATGSYELTVTYNVLHHPSSCYKLHSPEIFQTLLQNFALLQCFRRLTSKNKNRTTFAGKFVD